MRSDVYDNPADDPEAQKFLHTIAQAGKDQLPRMEFADWLDENGYNNAATGQRWAAKNGKYPRVAAAGEGYHSGGWHFDQMHQSKIDHDPDNPHELPNVFHTLSDYEPEEHRGLGARFGGNNHAYDMLAGTDPKAGALLNEKAFLGRSHQLDYNEDGNPHYRVRDDAKL